MSHTSRNMEDSGAEGETEKNWRSEEHFDIRHGDAELGVCPAGFHSCFGPVLPHDAPFWNGNAYCVILCCKCIINLLFILI